LKILRTTFLYLAICAGFQQFRVFKYLITGPAFLNKQKYDSNTIITITGIKKVPSKKLSQFVSKKLYKRDNNNNKNKK